VLVKGLDGKKIVQISIGPQHGIALDEHGYVYVWGYNGYCRLGLGDQVDGLIAKLVPQFSGEHKMARGWKVFAGATNSVVVDNQKMYWMAGKWKNTGDGSAGQPYSSFRYMPDIQGCKVETAGSGPVVHFCTCPDDDNKTMTIGWGQNASHGELGLGNDAPLSATKPQKVEPLQGVDVFQIVANQGTTLMLARPGDEVSSLPRHPGLAEPQDICAACKKEDGIGEPIECEKCETPYHLGCLKPPLTAVPEDEWFCAACLSNPGQPVGHFTLPKKKPQSEHKRKAEADGSPQKRRK